MDEIQDWFGTILSMKTIKKLLQKLQPPVKHKVTYLIWEKIIKLVDTYVKIIILSRPTLLCYNNSLLLAHS